MADRTPIRTIPLALRRRNRLGPNSVCAICGYCDPLALIAVSRNWLKSLRIDLPLTLLEEDHVAGRRNDPDLISTICRNCHAVLTELREQERFNMKRQPKARLRLALRFEGVELFQSLPSQVAAINEKEHPASSSILYEPVDEVAGRECLSTA